MPVCVEKNALNLIYLANQLDLDFKNWNANKIKMLIIR